MAAINLDVGANTRRAERDIQKLVNKSYNINLKTKGDQPLGRITGKVNEFTKSLDASNARVIAFGASAGLIYGVERAFTALASSVINTQKSLAEINVILNASSSELSKFGSSLFSIAKNTGQSFEEVAKAATEFSRQGLGIVETLKRTNEALILSRLSGLDAAKSVEALTAAVNSFASQAVTATEIVNKFANVDAAFAVSSADLADAISRVGSSAAQSGVNLDELIAIVTAAQQTTARGGAVIGNSFKTIFTRLQRTQVVDLLEKLGVNTTDGSGQIKSTINLLTDLAKVYDQLGTLQQAEVAEKVGGVFQINILKAALADLGKEFSVYNNALQVAGSSTDQAIRRNEELNKTYSAQLNALQENAKQLGASVGDRLFGPAFNRVVGNANDILGGVNAGDGNNIGATLGKGILDGLGQVIAGPGLALLGGIFIKLFADLSKFVGGSLQELLNLNNASKQQQALQQSITAILQKNPDLFKLMQQGSAGLNKGAEILLNSLRAQTIELQAQESIAARIAAQLIKVSNVKVVGGVPIAPTPGKKVGKAHGYIPNFANLQSGVSPEEAMGEVIAAKEYKKPYKVKPEEVYKRKIYNGKGGFEIATVSEQETVFDEKRGGKKGTWVVPPTGFANGFIPNFVKEASQKTTNKREIQKRINSQIQNYKFLIPSKTEGGGLGRDGNIPGGERKGFTFPAQTAYAPKFKKEAQKTDSLEDQIFQDVIKRAANYTKQLDPPGMAVNEGKINQNFDITPGAKGALQGAIGSTFEVAIASALDYQAALRKEGGDFDVRGGTGLAKVQDLFGTGSFLAADFKSSTSPGNIKSFRDKIIKEMGVGTEFSQEERMANAKDEAKRQIRSKYPILFDRRGARRTGLKSQEVIDAEKKYNEELDKLAKDIYRQKYSYAAGYIPNFSALQDAISRERGAGVPSNKIYISQDKRLASGYNPFGLGVFNTRDEPTSASRSQAIKSKGYAKGYVPNFAMGDDTAPESLTSSIGAISAQLGSLAFMLSFSSGQYKKSLQEIIQANSASAKAQARTTLELQKTSSGIRNTSGAFLEAQQKIKAAERVAQAQLKSGGTIPQKAGAALSSNALAISLIGPIVAETVANAIGQQSKEARVGSSSVSALGQAASFAGFGAMMTPANPLIGGGIGLAAGAMLGLVDVIKQASTNIPELSEAARKASENLTKINDSGQKVQTQFEQIQQLRDAGQQEKAGKLEADLLNLIGQEFRDRPELASGAASAVINKDFVSLQKIIAENTEAVRKNTLAKEQELLAGKFSEGFGNKDTTKQFEDLIKIGEIPLEGLQKLKDVVTQQRDVQTTVRAAGGTVAVETIDKDIYKISEEIRETLNQYSQSFASLPTEFQNQIIESIRGGDIQDISKFLGDLGKSIQNGINIQEAINRNSAKGNPIIAAITDALSRAQTIYEKFATNAQAAVDLQLTGQKAIREASRNIQSSQGERDERILRAAGNPAAADKVAIDTELKDFANEFNNELNSSFDSIISNVAAAFIASGRNNLAGFSNIGSGAQGAESTARQNIDAAETFAEAFKQQFNIENFKDLIGVGGENFDLQTFKGFDVQSVLNEISSKLNIDPNDDASKNLLEKIRESLQQANQKLLEQKALLAQQLTVLANQQFAKNFEELMSAITKSFGGMESFRNFNNQFELTDELSRAIGSLNGLSKASGPNTDIESARAISSIVEELSKLAGSNIATDSQGNLRGVMAPMIDAIVKGRALDIEKTINSVLGPLSKTRQGAGLQTAFLDELIENLGISRTKEDGTEKTREELVNEVSVKTAEMQTKAELGVGEVNNQILQQAFDKLPPALQQAFKEQGMGAFSSIEQIAAAEQSKHTTLLQEIVNVLKQMAGVEGQFGSNTTGTSFSNDQAGGGGLNPTGVGPASEITSKTPDSIVSRANLPGQDPRAKSFNEGVSVLEDTKFTGLDGQEKTISKWFNEQAPLDLNSVLNTKVSDLNGVISTEINPDMLPDNSPENPLLPPKNMIDTGINDAIGSSVNEVVKNNPDLQGVGNLINTEIVSPETKISETTPSAQSIIDEMNDKYFSSSVSSNVTPETSSSSSKAGNKAKGSIPKGLQNEMSSIRKGVGGAKPWHSPYMAEINGEPAYVHTGEMIVPNMGNTGETGVLTPDMQKALNLAEGYVPDDAAVAAFLSQFRKKRNFGDAGYKKFRDWFRTNDAAAPKNIGGAPRTKGFGLQNFARYGNDFDLFSDNLKGAGGFYNRNKKFTAYNTGGPPPIPGESSFDRNFMNDRSFAKYRFSRNDFRVRRHEFGHAMQDTTAGAKSGQMFKGKLGQFFGNTERFGNWSEVVAETQARIVEQKSTIKGIAKMMQDAKAYAKYYKDYPEIAETFKKISYLRELGDIGAGNDFDFISKPLGTMSRKIMSGNISVSELRKGLVEQFKNIPQLIQDPTMLKQLGGGLLKGGAVGMATQTAGEKFIPKFDGKTSDGDMSYWEEVANEIRSFGIATGSGAAAGAAATGGAGTIFGAITGGATDVLGKLWRLGSSSVELAKLKFDEYGREDKLKEQQSEIAKKTKKLAEQAKIRREEKLNALKSAPKSERKSEPKLATKSGVSMPPMPTTLDFANAAIKNKQETPFNKQVIKTQTAPSNPYRLIGGKGDAPATQVDTKTGTGTLVPRAEPVNPYRLIGGKGDAPATQVDTKTGTGTLVPRAEPVNPNRNISTSTSYAQDPEVQKAIKSGDVRAIEQATIKARARAGKSFQTPGSDFARQYKFKEDLAKQIGGIVTGGTQAEVDAYYKKKAEEAGMSDRFITDYVEPRERQIIKEQEKKAKRAELEKTLDWVYKDNPEGKKNFLQKFGYTNFTEKGASSRLKEILDGYDALMKGNRSMAQTQAYQAKKQEISRLFNSGQYDQIYKLYDSLPRSNQPRGTRTPEGFIVAPPTPIPEPTYKSAEEARAAGRTVLKTAGVAAYTRKDGTTVPNAPYINPEIPRAMAAANEAATMASIKQTLAISDFNSGRGPDPRKMDFTPKVLPPVLDYSRSVSQPGLSNYNRIMNLSPINPNGIDLYENLKGLEREDGSVSTGIPKSWETLYKIEEEKKKAKNYAEGLLNKSFLTELANGGNPLKDNIPGIGPVVIDKNTEYSAANAAASKGLSQGMHESRKMQNISAQGFVPNFAVKKAETQESANNFSIKLGDMVINSSAVQNNPELYGKDFGAELQSRIPDVVEQIKSDMDKKYGRAMELVRRNENIFTNKIPPKSRGNAALRT